MGLTINLDSNGIRFAYVIVEYKKEEVHLLEVKEDILDIKQLKLESENRLPLLVSIQGKGVLTKELSISEDTTEEALIAKVLPNAVLQDFYISRIFIEASRSLVSVIRKETCDTVLSALPQDRLVRLSIGPNQLTILEIIDKHQSWYFNKYCWQSSDRRLITNKLEELSNLPQSQKIGEETLPTACIEAYAHGIAFFSSNTSGSVSLEQFNKNQKELVFSKIFTVSGWLILIFLLISLLINFLYFDFYSKRHEKLSLKLQHNSLVLSQIDNLNQQIEFKKDFIQYNHTGQTKYSFYMDRLAFLLPKKIVLDEMSLNPLLKRVKQNKEIQIRQNKVIIRGISPNSTILNQWIKEIQKENWVLDTEIIEYNRKAANLSGNFELMIDFTKE